MSLRTLVFDLLKSDAALNAYGINENSLFGANAPDSPAATLARWMIMRWGATEPRLGRDTSSARHQLQVWAYDREPDYGAINGMLARVCSLVLPLKAVYTGVGWITEVVDAGSSEDGWDPAYQAVTRSWSFTIVASGEEG